MTGLATSQSFVSADSPAAWASPADGTDDRPSALDLGRLPTTALPELAALGRAIGAIAPDATLCVTMIYDKEPTCMWVRPHDPVDAALLDSAAFSYQVYSIEIDGHVVGACHAWRARSVVASLSLNEVLPPLLDIAATVMNSRTLNQETTRSLNQLFVAHESVRAFNSSASPLDLMQQAVTIITHTLPFVHCGIWLTEGDYLVLHAAAGLKDATDVLALPLALTCADAVLRDETTRVFTAPFPDDIYLPTLDDGALPTALLSAPLMTRRETRGVLEVYTTDAHHFSDDEMFLLSVLAAEAAVALDNVLLTQDLRDKEQRLTLFAQKLVQSQEEERRRIAREIHDGLAQSIVSAYQIFQAHQHALPKKRTFPQFEQGLDILRSCIDESRQVLSDLRPTLLDDLGLLQALAHYLQSLATQEGWQAEFSVHGEMGDFAPSLEITVFRLVQEALTNARKHAHAPRVRVELARIAQRLYVTVQDWGVGFVVPSSLPLDAPPQRPMIAGRMGMIGMRERVALAQGECDITSSPGQGTTISIILPVLTKKNAESVP